jgi:hypothetical protein
VGLRAGLDDVEERKILTLLGLKNSEPSLVQPVASRYTDCATPAPNYPTVATKIHNKPSTLCTLFTHTHTHTSSLNKFVFEEQKGVRTLLAHQFGVSEAAVSVYLR